MASVASQLIEKVTAHAQSDSLEDAQEVCTDGTYFPNNLRINTDVFKEHAFSLYQNSNCCGHCRKNLTSYNILLINICH